MMRICVWIGLLLIAAGNMPATAQTIGYAEAIDRLAVACGQDIDRHCKAVNLGGGRIQSCLAENQAKISATCRTTLSEVRTLLQKRAAARANVLKVCDADIQKLCPGVQPGDGNLLGCFLKAERAARPQCRQAVTDAGYR